MQMKIFLTILLLATIVSCTVSEPSEEKPSIEREGEPTIYGVEQHDGAMNKAIRHANETLADFKKALKSKNPDFHEFSLKMKFETDNGAEHIWISDIELSNGEYVGYVANTPEFTNQVQFGQQIQVDKKQISDWKYLDRDTLRGGYTIRLLRSQMSQEERKLFDQQLGYVIE
jgi:uncharacterized protein YegJ (DUF2314 family)